MSETAHSFEFYGKMLPLWTATQLENLNAAALRSRAMDLRDAVGQNQVPRMPRHPEQVIEWILAVQHRLSSLNSPELSSPQAPPVDDYDQRSNHVVARANPAERGGVTEEQSTEAYNQGRIVADAARTRSRGQAGLLSWD
eukprot:GEMP01035753.1.p1 GENE.GEMP01035753.1~~GEMP01035753.1.p1  ORF type:complete len:140 (+),score=29.56 GEMP01035753.1:132-551(+)